MRKLKESEINNADERYLYEKENNEYENYSCLRRINQLTKSAKELSLGRKVLDMGCAQATASLILAENGFDVTAFDLNRNFLDYAKKKKEFGEISFVCGNAMHLPFRKNYFDIIIMGELIEHVAYPEKLIKQAKRCMKKNGILIITTPNNHLFLGRISGCRAPLFENIAERKKMRARQFGPSGSDHLFVFNIDCLKNLLLKEKFRVIDAGYTNCFIINPLSYKILSIFPKFLLDFLDSLIVKIPFLNKKTSLGLYIASKK